MSKFAKCFPICLFQNPISKMGKLSLRAQRKNFQFARPASLSSGLHAHSPSPGARGGALRPAPLKHPGTLRGTLSLNDTAAAAQPPAKLRINPNWRGYGGPGTSAPWRQAAPAPVPKSTLLIHVRAPASPASLRLPPPEPAWLRRVGGPLPGGKLGTGLSFLNPRGAQAPNAVSPLGGLGL